MGCVYHDGQQDCALLCVNLEIAATSYKPLSLTHLKYFDRGRCIILTLYPGLNEACSGFDHIGHNNWFNLIFLWVIPKYVLSSSLGQFEPSSPPSCAPFLLTICSGVWIIFPAIIAYDVGTEILQGLEIAAGLPNKKDQ